MNIETTLRCPKCFHDAAQVVGSKPDFDGSGQVVSTTYDYRCSVCGHTFQWRDKPDGEAT
jgi:DNA-directed RNA polymerase subunit RPC12/RpoP